MASIAFAKIQDVSAMQSWCDQVRRTPDENQEVLKKINSNSKPSLDSYDVFVFLALATALDYEVLLSLKIAKFSRDLFRHFAGVSAKDNPFELAIGDYVRIRDALVQYKLLGTAFPSFSIWKHK